MSDKNETRDTRHEIQDTRYKISYAGSFSVDMRYFCVEGSYDDILYRTVA